MEEFNLIENVNGIYLKPLNPTENKPVIEYYRALIADMESVLRGEMVLFEVFHYQEDLQTGKTAKIQHQSQYVAATDPERELLQYFLEHSIDVSTLEYRPFESAEVAKMLYKLKKDLGLAQ